MKGSDLEGKGAIQLPDKIQQALQIQKGALVVVRPVVEDNKLGEEKGNFRKHGRAGRSGHFCLSRSRTRGQNLQRKIQSTSVCLFLPRKSARTPVSLDIFCEANPKRL